MVTRKGQVLFDSDNAVVVPEISTPTPEANRGKVYAKSDNHLYFQDGAGVEHEILLAGKHLAEMYFYENTVQSPIDAQDQWHLGLGFTAGYLDDWALDLGSAGSIASFEDYSGTVPGTIRANDVGHGLLTGTTVSITGTSAPNDYSGVYKITVINADSFYFVNAGWNATTTATWVEGTALVASASAAGKYHIASSGSLTPSTNNDTLDFKVFVNSVPQIKTESRVRTQNATEWSTVAGTGFVSISDGDKVMGGVKNLSGSGNITVRYANINLHRI